MRLMSTLAALAALALAAPASAAVMSATYTGTINAYNGVDQAGIFGAVGENLTGEAFALNFVYDTQLGNLAQHPAGGESLVGGWGSGAGQPLLSTSLTILGHTETQSGTFYTTVTWVAPDWNEVMHNGGLTPGAPYFMAMMHTADPLPSDLVTPFSAAVDPNASLNVAQFQLPGGNNQWPYFLMEGTPTSVVVTKLGESPGGVLGGVPEPSAWALMIVGFGAAGAMLRSRRAGALV